MRRAVLLFFLLAFVVRPLAASSAEPSQPSVLVVKIDGSIDRTLAAYFTESLGKAEADGSTVVIQLDTAGTLDQDAMAIARLIHDATVPVIVWVGPAPAKAAGAGLLFLYAASLAAVAPGAGVGPLHPLDLARAEATTKSAIENEAIEWVTDFGRPSDLVFPDHPVPAQAALDGNIAQVAAISITDLLEKLDGRTVAAAAGNVTLRTRIAELESEQPVTVRFTEPGPVDRALHAAASPAAVYVLLVLGFAALAFELTQPGFGFAGFSGVAMLGLGFYGLTAVPASWIGLALLLLGVALMTADVQLRRLGLLTGVGLAAFLAGSFLAFGHVSPAIRISPWLIGSFAVGSLLYYGFGLTVALQSRERITSTRRGLVGLVGETRGELKPEGPVYVKGTLWRGRSTDGPIPAGTRVRVRGVDGLILRVEPEAEPGDD